MRWIMLIVAILGLAGIWNSFVSNETTCKTEQFINYVDSLKAAGWEEHAALEKAIKKYEHESWR